MENFKKSIIAGVIFLIVIAAIATVLGLNGMQSGSALPSGLGGLPDSSLDMPSAKMGIATQEMFEAPMTSDISNFDTVDKKIIKNGNLNLKVGSVDKAAENIAKIAKDNGGDVFSSNVYNRNNVKSGTVQVKVPAANFEKTLAEIKKAAALVVQESTSGQDVTEEYADLQAQLRNKQAEEQQYLEIMKQAQKISDILEVTQQLSRVRGEIEQVQGRIKFLNSQADMSLITVSMTEDTNITISDSWRPWQVMKDAVNNLIRKAQGFINFVIVLIVTVIPVVILYLILAYVIYFIGKKIYFRFKKPE